MTGHPTGERYYLPPRGYKHSSVSSDHSQSQRKADVQMKELGEEGGLHGGGRLVKYLLRRGEELALRGEAFERAEVSEEA